MAAISRMIARYLKKAESESSKVRVGREVFSVGHCCVVQVPELLLEVRKCGLFERVSSILNYQEETRVGSRRSSDQDSNINDTQNK